MEWKNQYNSFNSWKGLLYAKWYEAVAKGEFLPPVEASIDPIHACNINCDHCNAARYLDGAQRIPNEHLMNLVRFLGTWGVKAICFGGGGEPTLHTGLPEAIRRTICAGMQASVATNGTVFTDDLIQALTLCRWVGISVDAATPETYVSFKKRDMFNKVIDNISRLVKASKDCDVSYKFLISPFNQHEIYDACVLAKKIGVRDFHARPADLRHQGMGAQIQRQFDTEDIGKQFELCHAIEDDSFRVFTVQHKFNADLTPRRDFSHCYAAPLCIQICADGNVYFCVDQRNQAKYLLGAHYPDPNNILTFWGGENHKKLVFDTGVQGCNTRCTWSPYNKQCEELFIKKHDPMCWRFI